jgi:hypothetical protein
MKKAKMLGFLATAIMAVLLMMPFMPVSVWASGPPNVPQNFIAVPGQVPVDNGAGYTFDVCAFTNTNDGWNGRPWAFASLTPGSARPKVLLSSVTAISQHTVRFKVDNMDEIDSDVFWDTWFANISGGGETFYPFTWTNKFEDAEATCMFEGWEAFRIRESFKPNVTYTLTVGAQGFADAVYTFTWIPSLPPTALISDNIEVILEAGAPTEAAASLNINVNNRGVANVSISNSVVNGILRAVTNTARANRQTVEDLHITLNIESASEAELTTLNVDLQKTVLDNLNQTNAALTISSTAYHIGFDSQTIEEMAGFLRSGHLRMAASPVANNRVPAALRRMIDNRPVFNFSLRNNNRVVHLEAGTLTFRIPYTLRDGEDPENLFIIKILNRGYERIDAVYEEGWITWAGAANGQYGVGMD